MVVAVRSEKEIREKIGILKTELMGSRKKNNLNNEIIEAFWIIVLCWVLGEG